MKKEKKIILYKMTYTYSFETFFKVDIKEYEFIKKGDLYINDVEEVSIPKNLIGTMNPYEHSMWSFDENPEVFVNELIRIQEETKRDADRFINACLEYKKTITTEEKVKVKVFCYIYSFDTGFSVFEYDAVKYDNSYAIDSKTLIDIDLIDKIINKRNGSLIMYSLKNNKKNFIEKITEYIQDTN